MTNIYINTLNIQAIDDNHVRTKAFVDHFHNENGQSSRDIGLQFYDESNDLVKINQDTNFNEFEFLNIDNLSNKSGHNLDKDLTTKQYVVDSIGKIIVLKFIQALEHYFEMKFPLAMIVLLSLNNLKFNLQIQQYLKFPTEVMSFKSQKILDVTTETITGKFQFFKKKQKFPPVQEN